MSSFRPATVQDELFFYYWRRRDEGAGIKGGWYGGPRTDRETHRRWYRERIHTARLLVWEHMNDRNGIARIDSNGEVAFSTEPKWGHKLLEDLLWFAKTYDGRLKVTVDEGDEDRAAALMRAGFVESSVRFFCYRPEEEAA